MAVLTSGSRRRGWRGDRGFVTPFAAGLIPLLLLTGGFVAAATAVAATRHAAEAAADVAALAAARHALEGERPACDAAEHVAVENGARLVSCRLEGLEAVLTVAVSPPGRLASLGDVHGEARAGRG
ncbi:MAG TPA: Rv3654c family TadE-like protein [Mycobacteriales bacterium]|nr:Rv3654c family TadE-like protein [Mycobacteriales bacterium]